jgi:hypothetical protein
MKNSNAISVRESEFRLAIHLIHDCEAEALESVVYVETLAQSESDRWVPIVKAAGVKAN